VKPEPVPPPSHWQTRVLRDAVARVPASHPSQPWRHPWSQANPAMRWAYLKQTSKHQRWMIRSHLTRWVLFLLIAAGVTAWATYPFLQGWGALIMVVLLLGFVFKPMEYYWFLFDRPDRTTLDFVTFARAWHAEQRAGWLAQAMRTSMPDVAAGRSRRRL
jgi:hypothetical protein